ncbi:hypothetical protein ACLOJK_007297 [Asimina triloba]
MHDCRVQREVLHLGKALHDQNALDLPNSDPDNVNTSACSLTVQIAAKRQKLIEGMSFGREDLGYKSTNLDSPMKKMLPLVTAGREQPPTTRKMALEIPK